MGVWGKRGQPTSYNSIVFTVKVSEVPSTSTVHDTTTSTRLGGTTITARVKAVKILVLRYFYTSRCLYKNICVQEQVGIQASVCCQ